LLVRLCWFVFVGSSSLVRRCWFVFVGSSLLVRLCWFLFVGLALGVFNNMNTFDTTNVEITLLDDGKNLPRQIT
jgi:hypothetical protein